MNRNTVIFVLVAAVVLYIASKPVVKLIRENMTRKQFIATFGPLVRLISRGTGLFPSVFLAQAILESGNGNSGLSKKGNNFFGIKADKSWKGKKVTMKTREVVGGKEIFVDAPFRAYDTPQESFVDRVNFLRGFKRYAGVFAASTPEQQARELQAAGYATDPNYATLLINLINSNGLKLYDS